MIPVPITEFKIRDTPYFYVGRFEDEEKELALKELKIVNETYIGPLHFWQGDYVVRRSKAYNSFCLLEEREGGNAEEFILEIRNDLENAGTVLMLEFLDLCATYTQAPKIIKELEKFYSNGTAVMNYTGKEHTNRVKALLKGVKRELQNSELRCQRNLTLKT